MASRRNRVDCQRYINRSTLYLHITKAVGQNAPCRRLSRNGASWFSVYSYACMPILDCYIVYRQYLIVIFLLLGDLQIQTIISHGRILPNLLLTRDVTLKNLITTTSLFHIYANHASTHTATLLNLRRSILIKNGFFVGLTSKISNSVEMVLHLEVACLTSPRVIKLNII